MTGLRELTQEAYMQGLKNEIKYFGLIESVEKRCDEINDLCHYMKFSTHRSIQKLMVEIIDLVKIREKEK